MFNVSVYCLHLVGCLIIMYKMSQENSTYDAAVVPRDMYYVV